MPDRDSDLAELRKLLEMQSAQIGALTSELRAKRQARKPKKKAKAKSKAIELNPPTVADLEQARARLRGWKMQVGTGSGTISQVMTAQGIRYRARVSIGKVDGKYKQRQVGKLHLTEDDAKRALAADHVVQAESPTLIGTSLETYGDRWLHLIREQASAKDSVSKWNGIISKAKFFRMPIDLLTRIDIKNWALNELPKVRKRRVTIKGSVRTEIILDECISTQTQKHCLGLVIRCLDAAVDEGLIQSNPARGVKLGKGKKAKPKWTFLTLKEIEAVLALDLTEEQRAAYSIAIYMGLRQGEIAALTWEDVDLEEGSIHVSKSWDSTTKNGDPRDVALSPVPSAALRAWKAHSKRTSGLVFPSPTGEVYARGHNWMWDGTHNDKGKRYPGIRERAGIVRPNVTFHSLRHTCASHLVAGSWDAPWTLSEVQLYLGHSSISVTQRYAHLAPGHLRDKAARLTLGCSDDDQEDDDPEGGEGSGSSSPPPTTQENSGWIQSEPENENPANSAESLARPPRLELGTVSLEGSQTPLKLHTNLDVLTESRLNQEIDHNRSELTLHLNLDQTGQIQNRPNTLSKVAEVLAVLGTADDPAGVLRAVAAALGAMSRVG